MYYAPRTSVAAQYDTKAPCDLATSWSAYDTSVLNPSPYQSWGAVFDGKYVYLVGSILSRFDTTQGQAGFKSSVALCFDTTASFTGTMSWVKFDTSTLDAKPLPFVS